MEIPYIHTLVYIFQLQIQHNLVDLDTLYLYIATDLYGHFG